MNTQARREKTEKLVLAALMTALVIVFQLLAEFTKVFGPFATAMALIPIVIGAAVCGTGVGTWLGFVFGVVVLLCPSTQAIFFPVSILGTVITVLVKGTACGFAAGIVYKLLSRCNIWVRAITAALLCPIVNTSIFMLGSYLFFMKGADAIAEMCGIPEASGLEVFWLLATANFIFEIGSNVVLSPVVVRLFNIKKLKKA